MKHLPKILIIFGVLVALSAAAALWQKSQVPTKASSAQMLDLIGEIDHAAKNVSAPLDLSGVAHYRTMLGFSVQRLRHWVAGCPRQEPLLNELGGIIYKLEHSHESMTFAFTVNHPVSSADEIADNMETRIKAELARFRKLAMATMGSR